MKTAKKRKKASPEKVFAKVERIERLLSDVLLSKMEAQSIARENAHKNVMAFISVVDLNLKRQVQQLISQVGTEEVRKFTTKRELISGGKYSINCAGDIFNSRTKMILPEDEPVFLVRAKDRFAMDILRVYHDLCVKAALPVAQLESLAKADAEVRDWRMKHADRVKNPD